MRSNPVGNSTSHQPKVAETAAPATAPAVPAAVSQPAPVRARVSVARTPQHPGPGEPEVLVPPDQAAALNRLMAAVRDGRTVLAPAAHDDGPLVIELLPTVAPIDVSRLPGDPADDVPPDIDSRKAGNHVSTQV
jgi:hypothetical protein